MMTEEYERFLVERLRGEPRLSVRRLRDLLESELGVRVSEAEIRRWMRVRGWVGIPRVLRGLPRGEVLDRMCEARTPLDGLQLRVLVLRLGLSTKPETQGEAARRLGIEVGALRRAEAEAADKVRRAVLGLAQEEPAGEPEGAPTRPTGGSKPRSERKRPQGGDRVGGGRRTGWSTRFRGLADEVGPEALRRELQQMTCAGEITEFDARVVRERVGLDGRAVPTQRALARSLGGSVWRVKLAEERTVAKVRRRQGLGEVRLSELEAHRRSRSRLYGTLGRAGVRAVVELCEETLGDDSTLEYAFGAAGLSGRQRQALAGYLGLDGRGPRSEPEVARELGISAGQVHRHRQAALRRLILYVLLREEPAEERRRAARESVGELVDRLYGRAAARVRRRTADGAMEAVLEAAIGPEGVSTAPAPPRERLGRLDVGFVGELVECSAGVLDRAEREIVRRRFGCGGRSATLGALGREFRLSTEGVRQAEIKAAAKLLRVLEMARGRGARAPSEAGHEAGVEVQG